MEHQVNQSNITDKRIIILGASSGIGLATAKAAAAEGAQITVVSGNASRLNQALKELPNSTLSYIVDLSKEEDIKSFFEQINDFDHLVYTAGENISLSNIADTDLAWARNYFNIRYWGAFAAVKYGAPKINQGGSICLTSGIASARPGAGWSLGASICAAMEGFTRAMAVELAPVRVNVVSPGVVKTNLWSGMPEGERESLYRSVGQVLPVRQVGEAEDVAQAYLYLMKQPYVTGQTLITDGGNVLV